MGNKASFYLCFEYYFPGFICLSTMLAPVISSLDEIYCIQFRGFRSLSPRRRHSAAKSTPASFTAASTLTIGIAISASSVFYIASHISSISAYTRIHSSTILLCSTIPTSWHSSIASASPLIVSASTNLWCALTIRFALSPSRIHMLWEKHNGYKRSQEDAELHFLSWLTHTKSA